MKKLFSVMLSLFCLCACTATPPQNTAQSEGASADTYVPLRAFVADGNLYYDTGLVSDQTPRCGTLDGRFTKTLKSGQTPQKDGECNFTGADGYQNATSITKEVPIKDVGWCIFKKADVPEETLKNLSYCMILTGKISDTANPSTLRILSESESVTIRDIYWPMLSSQAFTKAKYQTYTLDDRAANPDKWGLTVSADNVTPTGCTLRFEQLGGTIEGNLEYGFPYTLETADADGNWHTVPAIREPVWNLPAFLIPRNEVHETNLDWSYNYGALQPGAYRIGKEIADFVSGHPYAPEIYYAYFDITEDMLCGYPPKN